MGSSASSSQIDLVKSRRSFIDQSRLPKRREQFHGIEPPGISHGCCSAFCSEFASSHARNQTALCSRALLGQPLRYSIDASKPGTTSNDRSLLLDHSQRAQDYDLSGRSGSPIQDCSSEHWEGGSI